MILAAECTVEMKGWDSQGERGATVNFLLVGTTGGIKRERQSE